METQRVSRETLRFLAAERAAPAEGGEVTPPDDADVVAVQLSRGTVVMSRESLAALSPDMREMLFADSDVITAEDALAELEDGA